MDDDAFGGGDPFGGGGGDEDYHMDVVDRKWKRWLGEDADDDNELVDGDDDGDEDGTESDGESGDDDVDEPKGDTEFSRAAFNRTVYRNYPTLPKDALKHPSVDTSLMNGVQFQLFSGSQIKAFAEPIVYHSTLPEDRGVYYNGMGPIPDGMTCQRCGLSTEKCSGHFGYIKLVIPVCDPFHEREVMNILNCVCLQCLDLVCPHTDWRMVPPAKRLRFLGDKSKQFRNRRSEMCSGCNTPLQKIKRIKSEKKTDRDQGFQLITMIDGREHKELLPPERIRQILIAVNDDRGTPSRPPLKVIFGIQDVSIDNLMIKYLLVLPNICRPYCEIDGRPCDDDLTTLYLQIIKENENIKNYLAGQVPTTKSLTKKPIDVAKLIQESYKKLCFHIASLYHNKGGKGKQQVTGRPFKSLVARLKGKKGRMRGTNMGKRNDFAARTVISSGADLAVNEVGVPAYIAKKLTVPVIVNELNYDELTRLFEGVKIPNPEASRQSKKPAFIIEKQVNCVRRRESKIQPDALPKFFAFQIGDRVTISPDYLDHVNAEDFVPGCAGVACVRSNNIERFESLLKTGKITEITRSEGEYYTRVPIKHFKLQIGDVCERQLRDGDYVLMNRQPSLHKTSMMAHRAVIHPYYTYRLNLSVTTPYNADFDGDEMLSGPACAVAVRAEMHELMAVEKNLNSEQNSRPTIGIVQDGCMGVYEMTAQNYTVSVEDFMDCLVAADAEDSWASLVQRAKSLGQSVFTTRVLFSVLFPESYSDKIGDIEIVNGVLINGAVVKSKMGGAGGILQHLRHYYGAEFTIDYMTRLNRLAYRWMDSRAFSVGLADCVLPPETNSEIRSTVASAAQSAAAAMSTNVFHDSDLQKAYLEDRVIALLDGIRNQCQDIAVKAIDPSNRFMYMLLSGSKGSMINHTQIGVLLGQQLSFGERMPIDIDGGRRSLVCFDRSEMNDPRARGFVESNFLMGLNPYEMFFHMVGGREGLVDTATKTAKTGYLTRRIVKTLEDCSVRYDGSIRTNTGGVIEFLYGENLLDPAKLIVVGGKPLPCDPIGAARMFTLRALAKPSPALPDPTPLGLEQRNISELYKKTLKELRQLPRTPATKDEIARRKLEIECLTDLAQKSRGDGKPRTLVKQLKTRAKLLVG